MADMFELLAQVWHARGYLEENDNIREANLLCGDAILNYRTVQSFGYEHLVVETYRKLLYPGQRKQTLR